MDLFHREKTPGVASLHDTARKCWHKSRGQAVERGGWPGRGWPSSALTLVWKQKMVTEMDTTAVMIIAMMTALVLYTLQGKN